MNEDDFAKYLDQLATLSTSQHCQLLNSLHRVYRENWVNLPGDGYKAVAWRVKQAWQLLYFHLNPARRP